MTTSNTALINYFETTPQETMWTLMKMMDTFSQRTITRIKNDFPGAERLPGPGCAKRRKLAVHLAGQLRYNGSHDIAYLTRHITGFDAGVAYIEIVRDVIKALNSQLKTKVKVPRVAMLDEYEEIVCEQLLGIAFKNKSEDEIASML